MITHHLETFEKYSILFKENPDQVTILCTRPVSWAQCFPNQRSMPVYKKMLGMGSDTIFFFNLPVNIQKNRKGHFLLFNIFFYNFLPLSHSDADDNKSLIFEFIV
jgi:hypothetical protein